MYSIPADNGGKISKDLTLVADNILAPPFDYVL
jgi:hypothetical protein